VGLTEYHRKRHFDRTPEPKGKTAKAKGAAAERGRFVIQKHDATRLHYDFRLESDGVLKSWAVPKGPSLDPKEKRLAVEVEDHPIEYGTFEGIIPEGEYGGGTVLLWDQGHWQPEGDVRAGLKKGHLKFRLDGEKLQGGWALIRLRGDGGDERGKPNWLLIKEDDEEARPTRKGDITKQRPESVASGRALEEIAKGAEKRGEVWHSKPVTRGARHAALLAEDDEEEPKKKSSARSATAQTAAKKTARKAKGAALPDTVPPQLATLVAETPRGEEWIYEIKLDGYRIQAALGGGESKLVTRNGGEITNDQ
jgi:bifunctional non-homologous end joining protein LigD